MYKMLLGYNMELGYLIMDKRETIPRLEHNKTWKIKENDYLVNLVAQFEFIMTIIVVFGDSTIICDRSIYQLCSSVMRL